VIVPAQVTIPADQTSVTFNINAVDDTILNGTRDITITATPLNPGTTNPLNGGIGTAILQVTDNESPSLTLTVEREIIAENGSAIATITRNTDTTTELIVNVTSSDITEATVPQTVTIPVGSSSVTFTVSGVNDGVSDGNQPVTLTATANGFISGVKAINVSDIDVPDLVVTQLNPTLPTYTSKQSTFSYRVENKGIITATAPDKSGVNPPEKDPWIDRVYLSKDDQIDSSDTFLGEFSFSGSVNPGSFYERNISYVAPKNLGQYYLIAVTDTTNKIKEGSGENNNTLITPLTVTPGYRATVYTDITTAPMGTKIILNGQAFSNQNNSPVGYEFVTIKVAHNGTVRELSAFTDQNGNFTKEFQPLAGEAGNYDINAYFPNNSGEDTVPEDSFKLLGMRFEQNDQLLTQVTHNIVEGTTFNGTVKLQNLTDVGLSGLTASINGAPSNWTVTLTPAKQDLAGNEEITVNYSITVPDDQWQYDNFSLNLSTTEGITATLPVTVNVGSIVPHLVSSTNTITSGMLRGNQTLVEFTITNDGAATAENIQVVLPNAAWLSLASPPNISALAPGESTKVTLRLTPDGNLPLTEYKGNLVLDVEGNDGDLSVPFNFRAVSSAVGEIKINVEDELTYFAEGSPKLQGATVTLRDYYTNQVLATAVTDETGIIDLSNINEGYYNLDVTAENHDTYRQTVQLDAGEIENIDAFLSRQTVKYIWRVTPTEIQDQYTISVESVFETNIPAPVIVMDPPLIDLNDLQVVGQEMQINMTVTNHGLIAANDIRLDFSEHPFYKIEPLIEEVDSLGANSSLVIPIKITRIGDFDTVQTNLSTLAADFTTSSNQIGGTVPCYIDGVLFYQVICGPNGIEKNSKIPVTGVEGDCLPSGPANIINNSYGGPPNLTENNSSGEPRKTQTETTITSNTPIVLEPFTFCDPDVPKCLEDILKAIGDCIVSFIPIPRPIDCIKNVYSLLSDTNSASSYDIFKTLLGCLVEVPGTISTIWNVAECIYNIWNACPETNPTSETFSSSLVFNTQAADSFNVDTAIANLKEQYNRLEQIKSSLTYVFGDSVWFADQEGQVSNWLNYFLPDIEESSEGGSSISETEFSQLLNSPLPANVTSIDLENFVERYNRQINYWNAGIFNIADVPAGQSTDFLALDIWTNNFQAADQAIAISEAKGFTDIVAEVNFSVNDLAENLENELKELCAKVSIHIDQDAVMTRSAFIGELEVDNSNSTNLTNIAVTLQITDAQGNVVNNLFGITNPILNNISAVDGTGILSGDDPNTSIDEGIGTAKWTFIPTNLAAPETPTIYNIGGTLSYTENGNLVNVPLLATPITVYPQAELYLDYFHQRDVFADDPFTNEVIETSVPYSLAVLVRNQGYGEAKNLSITSGQPQIVDNEKGLLIDFQIIGSEVNGTGVSPSLTVDFGNIQPGQTAVADWLLKSSLQGKFIDYDATFEHINSLGKAELSLIKEVKIHELIQKVQADGDNLPDFLVNDVFDVNFDPDTIYFSDGETAPVKAVNNAVVGASIAPLQWDITATVDSGWTYYRLAEPSNSQYDIVKILRSDGTEISLDNIWTTDRTFPETGRPTYENNLHFFDYTTAGNTTYTIIYTNGGPTVTDIIDVSPDPRGTAVNAITVDFSEAIQANSFDFNDLSLTVNGGANLINSSVTILSLSPSRYQITGLNPLTSIDGEYVLTVNANGIQDTSGKVGHGLLTETWLKSVTGDSDTTHPLVTDIIPLLINNRNQPVSSLNITFSEKIDLSTFDWQDITLTRDGSTNLINNTVNVSAINDTTYRINNLNGLTLTEGIYTLTVNGSGIQDLSGNSGTGIQSESWVMDTTLPSIPTNITVTGVSPNNIAGLSPNNVETLHATSLQTLTGSGQQRINTTTPTIGGELGETGLKVFFYDQTTNELLKQATVTDTTFTANVSLPSPGSRVLEIRVEDAAGNTTTTSLNLFADVTKPAITQFLNVPTSTLNPVNYIDVQFSEAIDLSTFDKSDLTLIRDGVTLTLPDTVTVEYISGTTYRINGLGELTNASGTYSLRVDATTIQDNAGNSGDAPKTAIFTITPPPTPGVTLTQTGGNTSVTEGGNNDSYSLVLTTQPLSDVTINLSFGDQITIDQSSLIFTPTNWNSPQTVTISAVNDTLTEGNHGAIISHTVNSSDINYNAIALSNLSVNISDNDAEIQGQKWQDLDGDGIKDTGETGLQGWTIYLDSNTNGQLDEGEISVITDENGNYSFTDLRPGIYTVAEVMQSGWRQTYPLINVTTTGADIELSTPTTPLVSQETFSNNSAINLIHLDDFRNDPRFTDIKGQGYSTVIIDTGADLNHPLFGPDTDNNGIGDRIVYQYDFADNDNDATDKNNHGSHIASIAATIAPESNLIILKVFSDNGSGSFADLEQALQWVNQNSIAYKIASVNLSLGDSQNWTTATSRYGIGDELAAIVGQNIIISAAAGNGFSNFNSTPGLAYPAADPNVISVGAVWADDFGGRTFSNGAVDYTTEGDRIASFSQRHELLDVFAPGILITGANATGGTITMGGTSQAAPFIASIGTLSQQLAQTYLGRILSLSEFRTLLDTTSDLIIDGDDEQDNVVNTGESYPRINVLALAEGIINLTDTNSGEISGNTGNNATNDPLYVPDNTVSLVHTVTLTAGQIATNIDFGNQLIPDRPPVVNTPIEDVIVNEDAPNTVIDLSNVFTDPDGEAIALSIFVNNNTDLVTATIEGNNLILDYQDNHFGMGEITIRGTANGLFIDDTFTVTVNSVNDLPTVKNEIADQKAIANQTFNFTIPVDTFSDIEDSNLTYTLATDTILPAGITFNGSTFNGISTVHGTYNLTVIATDSQGATVSDSFIVNVLNEIKGTTNSETVNATENDDYINAGAGNDTVNGGLGKDILDGGSGNDRLLGGDEDDTYIIDSTRDVVVENYNQGHDTVNSMVNHTLTANVEDLILTGSSNITGTGNGLDNLITGNSGNNLLKGLGGKDTIDGAVGNDTLIGGAGDDLLTGGEGADNFLFGSGAVFAMNAFGVDRITDFTPGSDKIALSKTSFATLSSAIGGNLQTSELAIINDDNLAGSSSAKIVYNSATGNLFYNQNGVTDGLGSGGLFATLNGNLNANDVLI
jgi:Ca2+-binding RTX toxin-like protein